MRRHAAAIAFAVAVLAAAFLVLKPAVAASTEDDLAQAGAAGYVLGVFDTAAAAGVHCAPSDVPRALVVALASEFPPPPRVHVVGWLAGLYALAWPCAPEPAPPCPGWHCHEREHDV